MNKVFKALKDSTRRKILELLKKKDLTAGEISRHFNISKPSISHHLEVLFQAGLISRERKGQFIYYSLNTTLLEDLAYWILQLKTNKK